ncbi:hypothetical protein D9619_010911 [Psilocybe cf. subviscida]|uniref:Nephrocystin 3-like N-terminal domain-containing protein n=1 Tax=Psilocybe cf. subviscida TaxID=2480587 RepID=A0A8H5BA50_9AGAR|nr:hypothetical protein D9619_010911 [Psilocybe cf. subviscida]
MSMISGPVVITGGVFNQNIDQRQGQKSAMDHLKEAVAHTAFHNSGERFDPPRCHPNTRVAVLDMIKKWALRMDPYTRDAPILWLSGAAGAGKSAITQTLAERFHSMGLLVASFFFGRSDSTRNHARSLVSTIVYQLYSSLPPPEQSRILAVIDRDPLIFTKSLFAQFEALIVDPLQPLVDSGFWTSANAPHLIIIDGLDECLDRGMQRNVLLLLSASVRQFHLPLTFLLASRPEHDIQAMFSSLDFLPIHTRLFLDDTYLPDHDIELFLRDQFAKCRTTHPFRQMIPPDWPSDDVVQQIIRKSSGQFIYASVVAKYVNSSRHRPHHQLDVVLNLRPASRDLPFSELDALYNHIFSSVDNIDRILEVISFHIIFGNLLYISVIDIERILSLEVGEVTILLRDLGSVIAYDKPGWPLTILHASLVDYLLDSARSKEYFIDTTKHCTRHIADCFIYMSKVQFRGDSWICSERTADVAMICFEKCHLSLAPTESLYDAIRGFSIHRICNSVTPDTKADSQRRYLLHQLALNFLPALFKFLKKSNSAKYLDLYQQYQSEHDFILRENIKAWSPDGPMSLFFAMVTIYRKLPIGAFHESFSLVGKFDAHVQSPAVLQNDWDNEAMSGYLESLSDFLRDPKRSREFCAGPKLFSQAAKYCLFYLCDHTAFEQEAVPRIP